MYFASIFMVFQKYFKGILKYFNGISKYFKANLKKGYRLGSIKLTFESRRTMSRTKDI